MAKFNIGDKVIVAKKGGTWNIEGMMDKWLGKVMTIREVWGQGGYQMVEDENENNGGWIWNEEDLTPLDAVITIMRYGDKVSATNGKETAVVKIEIDYGDAVHEAVDKLFKKANEIHVGDIVEVVDDGKMYTTYSEWVAKNVNDKELIARYAYNRETMPSGSYEVVAIAPHNGDRSEPMLAYLKSGKYFGECFLIDVKGIKKVS